MTGGAVGAGGVLFAGDDDEVAVALLDVGGAAGVGFELVVAVAVAAEVEGPLGGVGRGAGGGVELVGPGEAPGRGLSGRGRLGLGFEGGKAEQEQGGDDGAERWSPGQCGGE